jgi:integrase
MPKPTANRAQNQTGRTPVETVIWDAEVPKLGLRTRHKRQTWIVQWRVDGKTKKQTLGALAEMSREAARFLAVSLIPADGTAPAPVLDDGAGPTVAAFGVQFLADRAASWKPSTAKAHKHAFSKHINPYFGAWKLSSITRDDVVKWMRELTCAAGTKNRTLAVLSGMMRHAELKGLRAPESNPCQNLRRHKPSFEATYLEGDDWRRLGKALTALAQEYPSEIGCLKFLALTGCRRGEALGLTWDMIDSARAALPDAKSGPRAIWLGRPAKRLLASFPKSNVYVFGADRAPLGSIDLTNVWTVVRERAQLGNLRVHDLRHSFASVAVNTGIDLKVVAGLLGHSDLGTTQGYAHLAEHPVQEASQRVGVYLAKALAPRRRKAAPQPCPDRFEEFVKSADTLADFCAGHGLNLGKFRAGLICWRKEQRAPGASL